MANKINPLAAAVGVGVAVVAGATAVALSNKDNRKKVGKMVAKGKDKAFELRDQVTKKMSNSERELSKKVSKVSKKVPTRTASKN